MELGDRLFALIRKEESNISLVILEKRFCEHGWALGLNQNVETRLIVWIAIRIVG